MLWHLLTTNLQWWTHTSLSALQLQPKQFLACYHTCLVSGNPDILYYDCGKFNSKLLLHFQNCTNAILSMSCLKWNNTNINLLTEQILEILWDFVQVQESLTKCLPPFTSIIPTCEHWDLYKQLRGLFKPLFQDVCVSHLKFWLGPIESV
jgi:hypothetical protein